MDFDWEASRENIRPLKSGRRIGDLKLALQRDDTEYKATIEEFEMQIRVLEGEELLDKWFDYICWVEQRSLSNTHEALSLMKRCVKHFKDKTEVRNNTKLVQIWIKISELTDQPDEIYNYMFTQDIGTSLALFYHEWAIHNELNSDKKKADEIFQLGINRNAEPVELLKEKQSEFTWRMTRAPKEGSGNDENDDAAEEEVFVKKRSALAPLPSTKSGKVNSLRVMPKDDKINNSGSKRAKGGRAPLCPVQSSASANKNRVSSSSVIEIFDDKYAPSSSLPTSSIGKSKKTTLPIDLNAKENAGKLEKMHRTKLSKKSTPTPSISEPPAVKPLAFEIFCDSEDIETTNVSHPINISSRKPLNSITSQVNEANIDIIQDIERDTNDPKAVHMYPKERIYMGACEVSLEELKGQLPKYKKQS